MVNTSIYPLSGYGQFLVSAVNLMVKSALPMYLDQIPNTQHSMSECIFHGCENPADSKFRIPCTTEIASRATFLNNIVPYGLCTLTKVF